MLANTAKLSINDMPEYLKPGVYIEETGNQFRSIADKGTNVAGFVGATELMPGDYKLKPLTSFFEFEEIYGGLNPLTSDTEPNPNYVAHAARAFFEGGGFRLYVAPVEVAGGVETSPENGEGYSEYASGLKALEGIEEISIVAAPGAMVGHSDDSSAAIAELLIEHCERMRYRFAVLDPPKSRTTEEIRSYRTRFDSKYAALYFPWVDIQNPLTGKEITLPPSGFVTGLYAQNDTNRGVHKAPANLNLSLVCGLERQVTSEESDLLNTEGINCLRCFEGRGHRVWGARTISSDPEWKYVNLRRYFNYLEQSIHHGTQWAVFEANTAQLWANIRASINSFLLAEWRAGALLGATPEQAFFIRCDSTTMTQSDIDTGRLICLIGVATIKPEEFIITRIEQWTADATTHR